MDRPVYFCGPPDAQQTSDSVGANSPGRPGQSARRRRRSASRGPGGGGAGASPGDSGTDDQATGVDGSKHEADRVNKGVERAHRSADDRTAFPGVQRHDLTALTTILNGSIMTLCGNLQVGCIMDALAGA